MKRIDVGDMAPDFTLKDNRVQDVSLSEYRGKKVLLSWHPLAWTAVCAQQMKSREDNLAEFEKYITQAQMNNEIVRDMETMPDNSWVTIRDTWRNEEW